MKKDLNSIVEQAKSEMTHQTDVLSFDIDRGTELTESDFRAVYENINGIMAEAYRKVAPDGETDENSEYIKRLSEVHKTAREAINESRNEYKKVAAFLKQRGALQLALVAPLDDLHKLESSGGLADAANILKVSSTVRMLDGYIQEVGEVELPGNYWQREKSNLMDGLLEDKAVGSNLLNAMISALNDEISSKANEASFFNSIDEDIASDNLNFWSNDKEIPADIVAERVSQIRYTVDMVSSLTDMKTKLADIPEAQGLRDYIDELILNAGEYLDKAREHYTKFIAAAPQKKVQIDQALKTYKNLCANLAAAKETGDNARIAGAEFALRQHMPIMSALSDDIYDYGQELPSSDVPLTVSQFTGFDVDTVDASDARSKYRENRESIEENESRIAALEVGQTETIDGRRITRTKDGYEVEGDNNPAHSPGEALMVASLPPTAGGLDMEGPARVGETRLASAETDEDNIEKNKKS